jgi:hypothetical protein
MKYIITALVLLVSLGSCKQFDCQDTLIDATLNNIIEVTDHPNNITFRNASNTALTVEAIKINAIKKSYQYKSKFTLLSGGINVISKYSFTESGVSYDLSDTLKTGEIIFRASKCGDDRIYTYDFKFK